MGVMADLFEAVNTCIIYMESINADLFDTDYFTKIDIFINFNAAYAKLLEFKGKQDECIKVCDTILSRKVNSTQRKTFDTIKSRANKGDKKPPAKAPAAQVKGNQQQKIVIPNYNPKPEELLISDCFAGLESAINSKDDKIKYDLLKKSMESLKTYKINFKTAPNLNNFVVNYPTYKMMYQIW